MSDYTESIGAYPPMVTTDEVDAGVTALIKALTDRDITAGNITIPGDYVQPGVRNRPREVPALWIDNEWVEIRPLVQAVLGARRAN